jgi:hypothetical protein
VACVVIAEGFGLLSNVMLQVEPALLAPPSLGVGDGIVVREGFG